MALDILRANRQNKAKFYQPYSLLYIVYVYNYAHAVTTHVTQFHNIRAWAQHTLLLKWLLTPLNIHAYTIHNGAHTHPRLLEQLPPSEWPAIQWFKRSRMLVANSIRKGGECEIVGGGWKIRTDGKATDTGVSCTILTNNIVLQIDWFFQRVVDFYRLKIKERMDIEGRQKEKERVGRKQ